MQKTIAILLVFSLFFLTIKKNFAQDTGHEKPGTNQAAGKHKLGEEYGGGKIFWLDESGLHGLIAHVADQSQKGIAWNPGKAMATGANADMVYSGQSNSDKIIRAQGNSSQYAARLCLDLSTSSNNIEYNDWYLPSKHELNLLYQQKNAVGGFNTASGIYWSSTESATTPETSAWEQEFRFGSQHEDDKDVPDQVRCIRKF